MSAKTIKKNVSYENRANTKNIYTIVYIFTNYNEYSKKNLYYYKHYLDLY